MRTMLFLLLLLPFSVSAQQDSIHLKCECTKDQIEKARNRAIIMRSGYNTNGWIIQPKCNNKSYFFHVRERDAKVGWYFDCVGGFNKKAKIASSGSKFFKVQISDRQDMRFDLITHTCGIVEEIPDGSLGEERQ